MPTLQAIAEQVPPIQEERESRAEQHDCCQRPALDEAASPAPNHADVAPVVHHHHEWYDGTGYPEGIAGEAIPLEARIISLCDAFDSMTSEQSYKAAVSMEAALRELDRNSGTQFDPRVVEAFQELAAQGAIEASSPSAP